MLNEVRITFDDKTNILTLINGKRKGKHNYAEAVSNKRGTERIRNFLQNPSYRQLYEMMNSRDFDDKKKEFKDKIFDSYFFFMFIIRIMSDGGRFEFYRKIEK